MEKYEKTIDLRSIGLTIVRRFGVILLFFIPTALATYIVTSRLMTKTYVSTITLSNTAAITTAQYQSMQLIFKDADTLFETAANLRADGHFHANKSVITENEISSGLSFGTLASNSISVTITFQSTDATITKWVLDEISEVSVAKIQTSLKLTNLKISSATGASAATKNSKERTYLLIGLAAGFVIACVVAFIDEIVGDEVYNVKDVTRMGLPGMDIAASAKPKN